MTKLTLDVQVSELGRWSLASGCVQLAHSLEEGLYAIIWAEEGPIRTKVEGIPSIPYEKIVKTPFQSAFYPVVSRLGDKEFRVRLEVRGLGGGFWDSLLGCCGCCEESEDPEILSRSQISYIPMRDGTMTGNQFITYKDGRRVTRVGKPDSKGNITGGDYLEIPCN